MKEYITDEALVLAANMVQNSMLDSLPAPSEYSTDFSDIFLKKMDRLIAVQKRHVRRHTIARYAVAAVLTLLVGSSLVLAVNLDARAAFTQWIREIYEQSIVYRFFGGATSENQVFIPSWLPEGYVEIGRTNSDTMGTFTYKNGGDILIFSYSTIQEGGQVELLSPNLHYEQVLVGSLPGDYYESADKTETKELIWIDDSRNVCFVLSSYLEKSVMLHIAEGVILLKDTN